jgi:phosphoribosylglycinamide formyltransferase-1
VHWVNETIDGGEIIAQSTVERLNSDTLEGLTSKIQRKEHFLLSQVICALAETQKINPQ